MAFQTPSTLGVVHSPIEYSESVRPAGKYRAAPWLPVKEFDNRANEYLVMYSGCPVAAVAPIDAAGKAAGYTDLVPASILQNLKATAADIVSYTATDVAVGTIDVLTGVAVTAVGTPDAAVVIAALNAAYAGAFDVTLQFPIGVLSYNAYRFPGGDGSNPNGFQFTNFGFQDQVAITCDYVLEVPVQAGTEVSLSQAAIAGVTQTFSNVASNPVTVGATTSDTALVSYSVTVDGVAVTPSSVVWGSTNDDIVITLDTALAGTETIAITYMSVVTASPMITGTPLYMLAASATSEVQIGSYVKAGTTEGSFTLWATTDNAGEIVGQIISADRTLNRGALDKVRTQYGSSALNTSRLGLNAALYSQPGSATSGKPGNLYRALGQEYAGVVRINLLK